MKFSEGIVLVSRSLSLSVASCLDDLLIMSKDNEMSVVATAYKSRTIQTDTLREPAGPGLWLTTERLSILLDAHPTVVSAHGVIVNL